MNIKKCFELAKYSSKNSDCKIKVGCVLVYKNKVLAISYNTTKTHPLQKIYNVYRSTNGRLFDVDKMNNGIHAEMSILITVSPSGWTEKSTSIRFICLNTLY